MLSIGIDVGGDRADRRGHPHVGADQIFDLPDGREHRGVVAAFEFRADLVEGGVRQRADEVHRDLAGQRRDTRAVLPAYGLGRDIVIAGRLADDLVGRGNIVADALDVGDRALDVLDFDDFVEDVLIGRKLLDHALELADIGGDVLGDIGDGVVREHQSQLRGLVARDGHARLEIGRLDIGHQAAFEAGAQAVVQQGHLHRRPVGGDDDLVSGFVDIVEGVEELDLGALLAGDELDIVHQKEIDVAVARAELLRRALLQGLDHLVGEVVALDVFDLFLRMVLADVLTDGEQQMRLAQARVAVDEQRVIRLARLFSHGQRRGVREFVRAADDEAVEGVAGHLRQGVVFLFRLAVDVRLFRQEQLKIKVRREQVGQHVADRAAEARVDDVPLEIGGDTDHQAAAVDVDRLALGKPGRDRRGRHFLGQGLDDLVPYVVERIDDKHLRENRSYGKTDIL